MPHHSESALSCFCIRLPPYYFPLYPSWQSDCLHPITVPPILSSFLSHAPFCLLNRFPLLALPYFSFAKLGQASCCKGTFPYCLEKVSKILGCGCSWSKFSCLRLNFFRTSLAFPFLLLAPSLMHVKITKAQCFNLNIKHSELWYTLQ